MLYQRHFGVIVVMDGSIWMMVVMMVMMRNGGRYVAGQAYWRAVLSVLAVMMTGRISWFPQDDRREDSLMAVFMIMVMVMVSSFPLNAPCPSRTNRASPIGNLGLLRIIVLRFLTGSFTYLRAIASSRKLNQLTTAVERWLTLRFYTRLGARRRKWSRCTAVHACATNTSPKTSKHPGKFILDGRIC